MPTAINETLGGNVRKFMRVAAGSLIGAVVFWLIAMFSDASARREAERHGRHYSSDKPSRRVWVGIGSVLGAVLTIFSPLLGVVRRHPRLAAMFGLTTLFGSIVFLRAGAEAVRVVDAQSGGYPGDTRPLSNGANWDVVGASAEQRLLREGGWPPPAAADTAGLEAFGRV